MLLEKSTGTRFVGDVIDTFQVGDIVFLGPNIPHRFRNSEEYFIKDSRLSVMATVIYFNADKLGQDFYDLPEMSPINILLQKQLRSVKSLPLLI